MAKGRSSLLDSLLKSSAAEFRFLDENGKGDDMVAVAAAFLDMARQVFDKNLVVKKWISLHV